MMSLTFGLFTQVSDSGPRGPLGFLCRLSVIAKIVFVLVSFAFSIYDLF